METRIGSESHQLFGAEEANLNGIADKSSEWSLNDWKWDGELFVASPRNVVPADGRNKQVSLDVANTLPLNSSSPCSEEVDFGFLGKEKGESEKQRRILVVEEDEPFDAAGSLSLNLGGVPCPVVAGDFVNWEGKNGKKCKQKAANCPSCQVEGCLVDLNESRDYHRRHKVCEMHSKASSAIVRNAMQRFCQQCSKFHALQEFDEGKRSCRRRLAGHNRRRRKTHPDLPVGGNPLMDEAASSLLMSLLRILSNLHNHSEQSKDQEFLAHLLGNLANIAGSSSPNNYSRLLQASQDPQKFVTTAETLSAAINMSIANAVPAQESSRPSCTTAKLTLVSDTQGPLEPSDRSMSISVSTIGMSSNGIGASLESAVKRVRMDFDLNNTYNDTFDCEEGSEKPVTPAYEGTCLPNSLSYLLQNSHRSTPPQMSGNSDSTSGQSLSSSNGDAQCQTDRIVFKLFGKDPNDLSLVLREQILDWLSHSPTDIESYIRPGCIVLTVYLRLAKSAWDDLCHDLGTYLNKLLNKSVVDFWTTGWMYVRVQNLVAFVYNGQVVLDMPFLVGYPYHCRILSVTPIAVSHSKTVKFTVKGFNLAQTRLLCSFDGKYLEQETTKTILEGTAMLAEHELSHCQTFSCTLPNAMGRGFIEVEDNGLSNGFFPFIVAEPDICSEICVLENAIDISSCYNQLQEKIDVDNAREQALDFINELGWLLRRNDMKSRSGETETSPSAFPLTRFRWLMAFSMDREWPAVVKKLLDILFNGMVEVGGLSASELILSEGLLHTAVRRNSEVLVEFLLRYVPDGTSKEMDPHKFLFRPDMLGPSNITPLHIAASSSGAESILDALTDDPGQLGIKAWKNLHDCTGFTPEDYARALAHDSYIQLVQKKIDEHRRDGQMAVNIQGDASEKVADGSKFDKLTDLEMNKGWSTTRQRPCCSCTTRQLAYHRSVSRTFLYRPAMLSTVGIALVCVCVGLLFKTPPQVFYVFPSFRWELLGYGSI